MTTHPGLEGPSSALPSDVSSPDDPSRRPSASSAPVFPAGALPSGECSPSSGASGLPSLAGRSPLKVAFIRPPRYYWPIVNESDNFLVPLAYPVLAAWLRQHIPDVSLRVLDCCVERMGYASLRTWLATERPDVVCIGEKVTYFHEALRAFTLIKEVLPQALTVGGGQVFTHLPEEALTRCLALDVVVRFEGEQTLLELLQALRQGRDPAQVAGLVYRGEGGFRHTAPRGLLPDLDALPMPAYDLMSMEKYAPFGKLWPRAATVQRARGCVDTCRFCSWWVQEGRPAADGSITPCFRSKSPQRMLEEVGYLYHRFGVRYLFWVDGTWNVDDAWLNAFCDGVRRRGYRLGWWAFFRVDRVEEQHANGTLRNMVQAGLRHVLVGVERGETAELEGLSKHGYTRERTMRAFHLLARHYPEVFRQGTLLTGLPDDDAPRLRGLVDYALDCNLDFAAFHPFTPFPGTPLWEELQASSLLEERDLARYDMFEPVLRTRHLTRAEVAAHTAWCYQAFVARRPWRYASRLFSPHGIRRRLHWWFLYSLSRTLAGDMAAAMTKGETFRGFAGVNALRPPGWYEG